MSYIKSRKRPLGHTARASGTTLGAAMLLGLAATSTQAAEEPAAPAAPAPASSAASAGQPADSVALPDITVSGTPLDSYYRATLRSPKFVQPVADTPKTIQIIGEKEIEDQQATTLTEALRNVPGVGTFFLGETGDTSTGDDIYMRGSSAAGSIFVDGIRDAGSVSRDTFNTDQIEVIEGPDGSTYGRTSLNGSINMVSKKARLYDATQADISYGTDDQKRATLDVNHQLGDDTAFRLNLMGQNSGTPGRDKVRSRRWGIAPTIGFGIGTDTRVDLSYEHVYQDNTPDAGVPMVGMPGYTASDLPRVDSENFYGTNDDFDKVKSDMLTARIKVNINDNLTFHDIARWGRTHQTYILTSLNGTPTAADPTMGRVMNAKDQVNTILTNQAGFVQDLNTGPLRHTLSYGIELTREKAEGREMQGAAPNADLYHPDADVSYNADYTGGGTNGTIDTYAAYIFDTIEIGKKWQLNGGLRLDHYNVDYSGTSACSTTNRHAPDCDGAPDGTPVTNVSSNESNNIWSWQIGGLYRINDHGNVYAQYAVASEPPGTNGLDFSHKSSHVENPAYKPQKGKTIEVGTKWQFAGDQLLLTAALFRTDIENQLERDDFGNYNQSGKKRVEGVELAMVGQITPNWDVSLGYTHMNAKVTQGTSVAEDGSDNLNYTPSDAFTSWTTYRLPSGLTLGGGARYIGEMSRDAKGTTDKPEHIGAYWIVDAMIKYDVTDNLAVQLNGYNLTNKDYIASINKKGDRYIPGQSRSVIMSLHMSF